MRGDVERTSGDGRPRHLRAVADDGPSDFRHHYLYHHRANVHDDACYYCHPHDVIHDDGCPGDHDDVVPCFLDNLTAVEYYLHDAVNAYGVPWRTGHHSYRGCAASVANVLRHALVGSALDLLKRVQQLGR